MKLFLVFLIFFAHLAESDAQSMHNSSSNGVLVNTLCLYKLSFVLDSNSTTRYTETMRLYFNKNFSRFISDGAFLLDSLTTIAEGKGTESIDDEFDGKLFNIVKNHHTMFNFNIYKDYKNKTISYYELLFTTYYMYKETLPVCKWKVLPEVGEINGYKCQHAITSYAGRTYEAWFTREIPTSDGPYKFYGLPGLIVKINDTRNQYSFELSKLIHLTSGSSLALPKRPFRQSTKQKVAKAAQDLKNNLPNMFSTMNPGTDTETKTKMRNKAKSNNNSIEIK